MRTAIHSKILGIEKEKTELLFEQMIEQVNQIEQLLTIAINEELVGIYERQINLVNHLQTNIEQMR